MYGVPANLPVHRLIGNSFNFIGLGRFQIQLHASDLVAIYIEGKWELQDSEGTVVDSQNSYTERGATHLPTIIDVPVTACTIDAPRSFTLSFQSGHALIIYDDGPQFESFSVHFDGEPEIYV